MNIRYPGVTVELVGQDGNAFYIIGRVVRALRQAGVGEDEVEEYRAQAMCGDYDNVLVTTMKWVNAV